MAKCIFGVFCGNFRPFLAVYKQKMRVLGDIEKCFSHKKESNNIFPLSSG
jgi:hypothetical protein